MKKGQFNFVWIFAIFAGGAILFLAIYGAVKTGDTMRFASDTEAGKSISIITDPLQSGFSEGSVGKISFQSEARINNICFGEGFGRNDISVATQSNIGEEWNLAGGATSIHNKYIFSEEVSEGSDFFVFSKPFDFPYRVADLIFLMDGDYCFVGAPDEVEDEILGLGFKNIDIVDSVSECSGEDVESVCFGTGNDCDAVVYGSCSSGCDSKYDFGRVVKGDSEMVYVGNLMYGAIFSEKLVYDCNVERLLFRASGVARVLYEKADYMGARGCDTNLKGNLVAWTGRIDEAVSEDLVSLNVLAKEMGKKNDREICGLW